MPLMSNVAFAMRRGVFAELELAIAARKKIDDDLVPLHIGDTHRAPPVLARIERAIAGASDEDLYAYGATAGMLSLREAIAEHAQKKSRALPNATASNVLVGVGATHALSCAARVLLEPGDDVLLASPYWPLAFGIITQTGARAIEVPLSPLLYEDASRDPYAILSRAATRTTKAIYVITPNNPDGHVLSPAHVAAISRFAIERDLWVFADEVYADYIYRGEHRSFAREPEMAERTITASSFSKSHALAGARVGYVIAPEKVVAAAQKISVHTAFNVPVAMQRVAHAALADAAWVETAREQYVAARDAVAHALVGAPVRFSLAHGGVYLFLEFAQLLDGRPLKTLLERAIARGVLLAPGESCGEAHATCARLCFTSVPLPRVLEGVARLREAMTELP